MGVECKRGLDARATSEALALALVYFRPNDFEPSFGMLMTAAVCIDS